MMRTIDHALDNGYTILWAADVSEKGFSSKLGVGVVPQIEAEDMLDGPKPEKEITEQMRQQAFDDYTTQDDHGMHIIGTAKDQNGKKNNLVEFLGYRTRTRRRHGICERGLRALQNHVDNIA